MTRTAAIIGVPTDLGTNRRGVDMGPSAIRYAGLVNELRNANIECHDAGDVQLSSEQFQTHSSHEDRVSAVKHITEQLQTLVTRHLARERIPIVLGGDHSISLGTLGAVAAQEEIGVVWFDAHADCNSPSTSPSGNIHGMVLAAALGLDKFSEDPWEVLTGISPSNVALVGTRDIDPGERRSIAKHDIATFSMSEIDTHGIADVCRQAIDHAAADVDAVHVSIDLDVLDPNEAPGVGTPVRGGITYREAHLAMEHIAEQLTDSDRLASFELVEVNPIRDEQNETAILATELAASAFGKRIL